MRIYFKSNAKYNFIKVKTFTSLPFLALKDNFRLQGEEAL